MNNQDCVTCFCDKCGFDVFLLLQASRNMWIRIIDVNDNPPNFVKSIYTISTNETSKLQLEVLALDSDSGNNGIVRYSIVSGGNGKLVVTIMSIKLILCQLRWLSSIGSKW